MSGVAQFDKHCYPKELRPSPFGVASPTLIYVKVRISIMGSRKELRFRAAARTLLALLFTIRNQVSLLPVLQHWLSGEESCLFRERTEVAWSSVFDFTDPSACRAVIRSADIELIPTAKGRFHAEVTQIGMNRLLVHQFRVSLPQVNTVAVKPGRISIGFLTEANLSPLLHCGLEVLPRDIVVNRSDVVHQRSDANLHYGTMSLAIDDLEDAAERIVGSELLKTTQTRIIRPHSGPTLRLLKLHKSVGQLAHDNPDILGLPQVLRALENELIHVMIRCLAEGTAVEPTAGSLRHDTIVTRFEEFLEANPDRPLYLTEICAAIGVAERTLRASCEEHLGMGPIRYLALRRMHLVRRTLLGSDPSKATVTKIVTDHGFWELGRFSVAYRLLFGESPSCTLQRRSEQSEVRPNRPSSLAATRLQAAEPNTEGWPEIRWAKVLEFADPLPCQAAVQGADVEMRPTTREVFTRKSRRQG